MGYFRRVVKCLFRIYEPNHEYWVRLDQIRIKPDFEKTRIGRDKYKAKWKFYREHGYCESKIILDKNFVLQDGYSSYVILGIAEGMDAKVAVMFDV